MSRIRVVPLIIVLAVTLSVLFGGWEVYRKFGLVLPLEEQLQQNQAVSHVESVVNGQDREIKVTLKKVDDLQTAYEDVEGTVNKTLGNYVKIQVVDNRGDELKRMFREIQPILYSGMAQGEFPSMIASSEQLLAEDGYQSSVSMNEKYIFVQIAKGDQYLYEVLPYQTMTAERMLSQGVSSL